MKKMSSENILNVSRILVAGCLYGIIIIPSAPVSTCIIGVTALTGTGVAIGFAGRALADKRKKEE